jgi:hypothetical protein
MPKTYNTLSNVTVGSVLTASDYNEAVENSNNFRVPPICALRRTTLFTMASANTDYAITFTAANEDADTETPTGMHDGSTDTDRITIRTDGVYLVTASCQFAAPNFVTSSRNMWIDMRGSINGQIVGDLQVPASGISSQHCVSILVKAAANDYFRMYVRHSDNVSRDVVVTTEPIIFSAAWVGQAS